MQSHVFADSNKFRAAVVYRCVLHCVCDCSPHAGSSRGAASILVEAGMVYKENLPEQHVKPPRVKANPNGKSGTRQSGRHKTRSEGGRVRASGRRKSTQPAEQRKKAAK